VILLDQQLLGRRGVCRDKNAVAKQDLTNAALKSSEAMQAEDRGLPKVGAHELESGYPG
jgi:hypothetical protein